MDEVVKAITDFVPKVQSAAGGMAGIFAALVALGLLGILFARIGR